MGIMVREATARVLDRRPTPDLRAVRGFGERPPGGREPVVSNAQLGILVLLGAEAMLFFGLIGAYFVFRYGSAVWPPPGQPHLPLLVTWVNTTVLLASGYTMHRARAAARDGNRSALARELATTAVLGVAFLLIQGSEWVRLVHHGLTLSSGTYGATFYALIGLHGVHVVGAVVWLLAVTWLARSGRITRERHVAVDLCAMYWNFVVGLWVLLFVLVYLR
jgi:cytochrome c oxidase subunit 3